MRKPNHRWVPRCAVAVVSGAVEAVGYVREGVAVEVWLTAALADVEVARVRLARALVPLALVVLRHPVHLPLRARRFQRATPLSAIRALGLRLGVGEGRRVGGCGAECTEYISG